MKVIHKAKEGQALVYTVLIFFFLMCFVLLVIDGGRAISWKIKMQNSADASALSGAIWQARALNMIALLNVGIIAGYSAIAIMIGVIAGSLGYLAPALSKAITKIYKIIKKMAKLQDTIKKINPVMVEAEVIRIARANKIAGALAITPSLPPWPILHIHRIGEDVSFDPTARWRKEENEFTYSPSDSGINTVLPLPYIRDNDFSDKQYVFVAAVDRPREMILPAMARLLNLKNPVLIDLPEINVAGYELSGDIGYVAVAQAKPVNRHESMRLLLIPEWDAALTPVTFAEDIPIPGLEEISEFISEDLICH